MDWKEWKEKYQAKFLDEHGKPLPKTVADMLAYHGRAGQGIKCATCIRLKKTTGLRQRLYCEVNSDYWKATYPACGMYSKKP